jgi:hypothetical protein
LPLHFTASASGSSRLKSRQRTRRARAHRLLPASALCVLGACATTAPEVGSAGRKLARSSGYEVREATEATDSSGMSFDAEQGYLSREDAEEAVKRHWSELVACYQRAGAARGFVEGAVKLRFVVDGQGRAATVHVLESGLGNFEVEQCLVAVGQTIAFPRPEGGRKTPFEHSLEFRSSGEIAVADLPESDLVRPLGAWLPRLASECHELGASEVMATLYLEPRGTVRSAGFASSTPLAEDRAACLLKTLRRWTMRIDGRGGLFRAHLALRADDLVNLPRPEPTPPDRRLSQGRRASGRR